MDESSLPDDKGQCCSRMPKILSAVVCLAGLLLLQHCGA